MANKLIAYLIVAHKNPQHLARLVRALDHQDVSFFIHIDKKTDIAPFQELLQDRDNVYWSDSRKRAIWKGRAFVESCMSLVERAHKTGDMFKHYVLLSGADYPVKSNADIIDFYKNHQKNYINHRIIPPSKSYLDYFKNKQYRFKISKRHFYDDLGINWNSNFGSFKHWMYRLYILFNILIVNTFAPKKYVDKSIEYYFGSAWRSINRESMVYIREFYKTQKKTNKVFKYADCPDELCFQTILMNSPYKDLCVDDNYRYIDRDREREYPVTFDDRDFDALANSHALFARKFDTKSDGLLKRIDHEILS